LFAVVVVPAVDGSLTSVDGNDPAVELATTLRALAIKTKTVGHMHRSLVPSLTKLIKLFTDAGDPANAKTCHEQRLAIMEAESAKETQDLETLGLSSGDSHINGPWLKDVSWFGLAQTGCSVVELWLALNPVVLRAV
jgi:hypothetical protein